MKTTSRRQRGFVLVTTMFTLLALTLVVTGYYSQTSASLQTSKVIAGSHVALSNARLGLQMGILAMRQRAFDASTITVPCTTTANLNDPGLTACIPSVGMNAVGFRSVLVDNGGANSNLNSGGLQYEYVVYLPPNAPPDRYIVRGIGYFGSTLTSRGLLSSVLEAEIDLGRGTPTTYTRPEGYGTE